MLKNRRCPTKLFHVATFMAIESLLSPQLRKIGCYRRFLLVFSISNSIWKSFLSPHFKGLSPHVANGDRVGQRCFRCMEENVPNREELNKPLFQNMYLWNNRAKMDRYETIFSNLCSRRAQERVIISWSSTHVYLWLKARKHLHVHQKWSKKCVFWGLLENKT